MHLAISILCISRHIHFAFDTPEFAQIDMFSVESSNTLVLLQLEEFADFVKDK